MNNGPEFIATAISQWLKRLGVLTLYIEPKALDRTDMPRAFHCRLRDKFFSQEQFESVRHACTRFAGIYHATEALNQLKIDSSTISTRSYDNGRRRTSEALGNGITESRTYRNDNLVSTITSSNSNLGDLSYTWDANKNKTSETISGTVQSSSTANNRYTYTAREWDQTTGLHYFRARWMSGISGRFLGRDPIGYLGNSMGLNEFFFSSPLHYVDPSGNQTTVGPPKPIIKQTPSGPEISIEYPSKNGGPNIKIPIQPTPPSTPPSSDCTACKFSECGTETTIPVTLKCQERQPCKSYGGWTNFCHILKIGVPGHRVAVGTKKLDVTYKCSCVADEMGNFIRGCWIPIHVPEGKCSNFYDYGPCDADPGY